MKIRRDNEFLLENFEDIRGTKVLIDNREDLKKMVDFLNKNEFYLHTQKHSCDQLLDLEWGKNIIIYVDQTRNFIGFRIDHEIDDFSGYREVDIESFPLEEDPEIILEKAENKYKKGDVLMCIMSIEPSFTIGKTYRISKIESSTTHLYVMIDNRGTNFYIYEDNIDKYFSSDWEEEPEIILESKIEDEDYDIIYRDKNLTILVPLTFNASDRTCKKTIWCTNDKNIFNRHIKQGDILFRFLYTDGYKLRLTWNYDDFGDSGFGNFHWGGAGHKDEYPVIYPRDISPTPFDVEKAEENYINNHQERTVKWTSKGYVVKSDNRDFIIHYKMFEMIKKIPQEARKKVIEYREKYEPNKK